MSRFANALRNFLGMEPLYQVGRNGKRPTREREIERFYPHSFQMPATPTRARKPQHS